MNARFGTHTRGPVRQSYLERRTNRTRYQTRDEARADVFDYIERFYNPRRRHSTLGQVSPDQFERAWATLG